VLDSLPMSPAATPIWEALCEAAGRHAGKTAVCRGEEIWSFETLLAKAAEARRWLSAEVPRGPVLFIAQNTPASLAFLLGAIGSGRAPLLADPAWGPKELEGIVRRCAVRAVALDGQPPTGLGWAVPQARAEGIHLHRVSIPAGELPTIPLRPDTVLGRFTSGTSGFSQCLQFRARAVLGAAASWRQAAGLSEKDRVLCLATLNNGLAFNTSLLALLLSGGSLVFHPGRLLVSSVIRALTTVKPTVLVAFPFVYEMLTGRMDRRLVEGLRLAVSSAAPLPPAVRDWWKTELGLSICDYYGLAEVGPCTFNDGTEPRSVGVPLPGVSFRITAENGAELPVGEVGRIRVQTASMASAYLDAEGPDYAANLDEQGYYVTRDLGLLTADGHLVLRGRVGRLVNIAGRKIDPAEVEKALKEMPGVGNVIVRGEEKGDRTVLAAYVESVVVSRADVVQFCLGRLAQYKIPQQITVLAELPRSSAGKISLGRLEATQAGRKS
jgi:acyl-coenzyme A synthetase/AMP-(fatty) acid ligase